MWWAAQLNQRIIVQISHPLSKTNIQIQKNMYKKLCVGDMWVLGTCGCGGHVGVGDMWVSGTYGCRGHVGVGDMCAGGHVGVGDMWVWGTFRWGGHEGVGDMWVWGTWGCRGLVFWGTCVPDSNFSFHKTETTDAHLSSPSAKVYYSTYRVSWQQVSLFVWSRVHAEKTEENGPERKMMYFIYVLSIHFSTPNVSQKMPSSAKLSQVIIFPSPFLIKHQLFWDIFVRFIFWQHSSLAYLSYSNY